MLFTNSNIKEKEKKGIRMTLSKKELSELYEDSTDVYKRNKVDRYLIRTKDGMFENLFVTHCSLNGISCKQNHMRMINNQKHW